MAAHDGPYFKAAGCQLIDVFGEAAIHVAFKVEKGGGYDDAVLVGDGVGLGCKVGVVEAKNREGEDEIPVNLVRGHRKGFWPR